MCCSCLNKYWLGLRFVFRVLPKWKNYSISGEYMKLTQFAFMILLWPADIVHLEHSDDIMISTFICCHVLIINFGVFSASSHKILSQSWPYLVWSMCKAGKTKTCLSPTLRGNKFLVKIVKLKIFLPGYSCASASRQTKEIISYNKQGSLNQNCEIWDLSVRIMFLCYHAAGVIGYIIY